jgi:hypothetical protein
MYEKSTLFQDKSSDETRNRRNVPQHNTIYIQQVYSQHHINWGKTKAISSKIRNETRVSTLSTLTQHRLVIPSQRNKTGRRNKRNTDSKEKNQTIPIYR